MLVGRSYLEQRQTTELASGERKGSGLGESESSPMDGLLRWKSDFSEFCWFLMKFSKRFPILLPPPSVPPPSLLLPLLLLLLIVSSMVEATLQRLFTLSLSLKFQWRWRLDLIRLSSVYLFNGDFLCSVSGIRLLGAKRKMLFCISR